MRGNVGRGGECGEDDRRCGEGMGEDMGKVRGKHSGMLYVN